MSRLFAVFFVPLFIQSHAFHIQPKIIDGTPSNASNIPFFVSIATDREAPPCCSGSLLGDRWILTAAHCLEKRTPLYVRLGVRPNNTFEETVAVADTYQHIPFGFFTDRKHNDIGLIELKHPIRLSRTIRPVALPQNCDNIEEAEHVYAIGSGRYDESKYSDGLVRQATFKAISCESNPLIRREGFLESSEICSVSITRQTTGAGDSGAPLFRQKDGVQYGVVKGIMFIYQVHSKISPHFDWISEKTGMSLPKC